MFLTLCCKGRYSTNSVLAHTLLLQPGDRSFFCCSKALSGVLSFFPPPSEGICLLLMAFLFSKGRVYTVRNVNSSGGSRSFVRPRKAAFPTATDSSRVLVPSQSGKKPGKLRIKHLSELQEEMWKARFGVGNPKLPLIG